MHSLGLDHGYYLSSCGACFTRSTKGGHPGVFPQLAWLSVVAHICAPQYFHSGETRTYNLIVEPEGCMMLLVAYRLHRSRSLLLYGRGHIPSEVNLSPVYTFARRLHSSMMMPAGRCTQTPWIIVMARGEIASHPQDSERGAFICAQHAHS